MSQSVDDPLLEHNYDGIQEYDNPLPGWWKMIFWATIIFCIPYTYWFHFGPGKSIHEQFEADMKANTIALNLSLDGETILELRDDPKMLELVQSKFSTICAACHRPDGSGMANLGPNLTDKHWKNVKQLTDIVRVLRDGVPGTSMLSQVSQLNKDERILMAAYVASLSLNPVDGLEPEGEVVPVWPAEASRGDTPAPDGNPEGSSDANPDGDPEPDSDSQE